MGLNDVLLLLGGAVLGYVIQVIGDQWRNVSDEFELWADLHVTSLEPNTGGVGTRLEYRLNGESVSHPHLVDFYLWSAGKSDITTDQFDSGRPLDLNFSVPIVSELEDKQFVALDETAIVTDPTGSIVIDPSIIRKRMASHYRFITDGVPKLTTVNPIANLTEVRSVSAQLRDPSPRRRFARQAGQTLIVGALILGLAYIVGIALWGVGGSAGWLPPFSTEASRASMLWFPVLFFPVFLGGALIGALSETVSRRARHALRVVRRSLSDKKALPWIK